MKIDNIFPKLLVLFVIAIGSRVSGMAAVMVPAAEADGSRFTVVIDAGHGGHDSGAVDNGQKEKDINLGVAKKLNSLIRKNLKEVRSVMTRDNDTYLTLKERADLANKSKGNLFISIHTNSVDKNYPSRNTVSGASVYALGPDKDRKNLEVAMRENSVIELEKNYGQRYSGFDPSKDESYIIFEMAQKKNLGQSLRFADMVQKSLIGNAGRGDRGVKQAGFWVLWATSMPAVLVELDFICNPKSAGYLGSESGQEQLAKAIYMALESYVKRGIYAELIEEDSESEEGNGIALLAQADLRMRNDALPVIEKVSGDASKRRRRSESARKSSEGRDLETKSIPLYRETDRLCKTATDFENGVMMAENGLDSQKKEVGNSKTVLKQSVGKLKKTAGKIASATRKVLPPDDGEGENKASANQSKQEREAGLVAQANVKPSEKRVMPASSPSNQAVSAVIPMSVERTGVSEQSMEMASNAGAKTRLLVSNSFATASTASNETYKILLIESEQFLKQSDPRFKGLRPIKTFRSGKQFCYTYGETGSKEEIEKTLSRVKEVIPEARIISSER